MARRAASRQPVRPLPDAPPRLPRGARRRPRRRRRSSRSCGGSTSAVAAVDGHGFAVTPFARDGRPERRGSASRPRAASGSRTRPATSRARTRRGTCSASSLWLEVVERLGLADAARERPRPRDRELRQRGARRGGRGARRAGASCACSSRPTPTRSVRRPARGARAPASPSARASPASPATRPYRALRARRSRTGALPFTCQGNLNGLAVEGGQTLGYEMASPRPAMPARPARRPGRRRRARERVRAAACARRAALGAVATAAARSTRCRPQGAWPLAPRVRARACLAHGAGRGVELRGAPPLASSCGRGRRSRTSVAHGILDDETYDWLAVVRGDARRPAARAARRRRGRRCGDANDARRPDDRDRRRRTRARPGSPGCWRSAPTARSRDDERVARALHGRPAIDRTDRERNGRHEELPRARHPVAEGLRAG